MLDGGKSQIRYTMGQNQNDSTVTNESLAQGYGGIPGTYGSFVGLATYNSDTANFRNIANSNSVYKSSANPPVDTYNPTNSVLEDIGTSNYPGYRFPRYNNDNTSRPASAPSFTEDHIYSVGVSTSGSYTKRVSLYSYGNYYTWAAAMANTSSYTYVTNSTNAGTSICPAGWHLPSSRYAYMISVSLGEGEYYVLSQSYGGKSFQTSSEGGDIISNRFRSFPNNYVYAGLREYGNSLDVEGTSGYYWTRSTSNAQTSDVLHLNDVYLTVGGGNYKYIASSVRCLINTSLVEIKLDHNDNTGSMSRVYGPLGDQFPYLPRISRPGYSFAGWNTVANGSGTNYQSGIVIPSDSTGITLYAQWTPE